MPTPIPKTLAEYKVQAKVDLELNQVNNTADADKPVSTPQQEAIDAIRQLPLGSAIGQALRAGAVDGDVVWSPHWTVDPANGEMNANPANKLAADPVVSPLRIGGHTITAGTFARRPVYRVDDRNNIYQTTEYSSNGAPYTVSTGIGYQNWQSGSKITQSGYQNRQNAWNSTQSGSYNTQIGFSHNQSGGVGYQAGSGNTQSGWYNSQTGKTNTQSGSYSFQYGRSLNDGGFQFVTMLGRDKTATVTKRAYFALDNGIWLKPFAGDAASPENGVMGYNSTTNKFRFYQGGAWQNLLSDNEAWRVDANGKTTVQLTHAAVLTSSPYTYLSTVKALSITGSVQRTHGVTTRTYISEMEWSQGGSLRLCYYNAAFPSSKTTQEGSSNLQIASNGSTQSGYYSIQTGNGTTQSGAYACLQIGNAATQSGSYNYQQGYCTQSGRYNFQVGSGNTQSGYYGLQVGKSLNNGGFYHVSMFGLGPKTATVTQRAYFSYSNGIWIKPVAVAPASPEDGVIYYDSALGKFRGYAAGAWVDLH